MGIDRLLGYRRSLGAVGVVDPGMIAYGDFSTMSGQHALLRLIDHRPGIDAVFAASDLMAAGALHALRRLGRRVPCDVAVIGFDDLPVAQQTDPRLTTVRQPLYEMGRTAAKTLLRRFVKVSMTHSLNPFLSRPAS